MERREKRMENRNRLIDQFHKNSQERVEIHLSKWKTQDYIDMRIWTLPNPAEPGSEQPTKKGICINIELLPKLIKALQKAQKEAEKTSEKPQEERSIKG